MALQPRTYCALSVCFLVGVLFLIPFQAHAQVAGCDEIEDNIGDWDALRSSLRDALSGDVNNQETSTNNTDANGGLGLAQWAAVVDRDGKVCAVVFSGSERDDQWPGSRVISMQKAYTANAFSLDGLALATANLWAAVQPGGSLFGLQFSNPVDPSEAYQGQSNVNASRFGEGDRDPAVGSRVGGVNVFGGGLALYSGGNVIGGLGTSGNTSCTDHVISWLVREDLGLEPNNKGVAPDDTDSIIFDVSDDGHGNPESAGGFGHPTCLNNPDGAPGTVSP